MTVCINTTKTHLIQEGAIRNTRDSKSGTHYFCYHIYKFDNEFNLILYLFNKDCWQPMATSGFPQFDSCYISISLDRMCGVMISMLASNVVDFGFEPGQVKHKTMELVIAVSQINMQQLVILIKSKDWLAGIRIMCLSGVTYLRYLWTVVSGLGLFCKIIIFCYW